jgi:RNA 3'-phosphate cyclase
VIEVDGSQKSGSGTILRLSVALAAVLNQSLHIHNIRRNRPQSGLRPQHLEAVLTAAKLCNAELEGAQLGSRELWFTPNKIRGGEFEAEIGTAGSIPMLLMTILPVCAFSEDKVQLRILNGGTDVWHSPTINYLRYVFLPTLKRMGLNAELTIHRYGYYPKGMGEVTVTVESCKSLRPLSLESFGDITAIKGVSVCTFLAERRVAERQAKAANNYLGEKGYAAEIQVVNDRSNPMQKGSSLVLWAETDAGVILGADSIGELRKPSEKVGREAAEKLCIEISAKATADIHLADMVIPYAALAEGRSAYLTRTLSEHLKTNIWLAEKLLKAKFDVKKTHERYKIEKLADA